MTHITQHVVFLACAHPLCREKFKVMVDHPTDIRSTEYGDDGNPEGYAIFRDKYLVQCPVCKQRSCKIIPGLITMEIDKR